MVKPRDEDDSQGAVNPADIIRPLKRALQKEADDEKAAIEAEEEKTRKRALNTVRREGVSLDLQQQHDAMKKTIEEKLKNKKS